MPAVRFDRVSRRFDDFMAVDDLSLEASDGEFLVLVGPSGSGKTTALRLLAGLEGVSSGEILIGDRVVTRLRPQDRNIAMVFQDYALYPQMTVAANMGFALRNRGLSPSIIDSKVRETAERLDLGPLLNRKPSQLSGGQRQRVALGRAIVRDPAVFLMDEPLSNLDASLRTAMRGEIKRLQRELGTTTVYVTHDQVEAMTMGDRIAVMRGGQLAQVGRPTDVYRRPADRFVGGFIGSPAMSFCEFDVERERDFTILARGDCRIELRQSTVPGVLDRVVIGVRPEDVVEWSSTSGQLGPVESRVLQAEDFGREWFAGVEFGSGARLTVRGDSLPLPDIGERLVFGMREAGLHFFDPLSGHRIGSAGDDEIPAPREAVRA